MRRVGGGGRGRVETKKYTKCWPDDGRSVQSSVPLQLKVEPEEGVGQVVVGVVIRLSGRRDFQKLPRVAVQVAVSMHRDL